MMEISYFQSMIYGPRLWVRLKCECDLHATMGTIKNLSCSPDSFECVHNCIFDSYGILHLTVNGLYEIHHSSVFYLCIFLLCELLKMCQTVLIHLCGHKGIFNTCGILHLKVNGISKHPHSPDSTCLSITSGTFFLKVNMLHNPNLTSISSTKS